MKTMGTILCALFVGSSVGAVSKRLLARFAFEPIFKKLEEIAE